MHCSLIILCAITFASAQPQLSESDLKAHFPLHDYEDHQIVPVIHGYHKQRNNRRVLQLTSFDKSLTLYLEPSDGYLAGDGTPVFMAKADPRLESGVRFMKIHNVLKPNAGFFHDRRYLAALTISYDDSGRPLIHGTINDTAIRPMPRALRNKFAKLHKRATRDPKTDCDDCSEYKEIRYTHDHVITKIKPAEGSEMEGRYRVVPRNEPFPGEQDQLKLNAVPEVIYPQLLITVESSLFDIFRQDIDSTVEYILSYWNGVDLRYRAFLAPNVRLSIAAIVLAQDVAATPYVANNFVNVDGYEGKRKLLYSAGVLEDEARYFYNETFYNEASVFLWMKKLRVEFDAAITMTANDLCDFVPKCVRSGEYSCIDKATAAATSCASLGSAFYTGACAYDPVEKKMEAFAILEDVGHFASLIPSAHEVGHLLGASHNIFNKHNCLTNDGYIMSYHLDITDKVFEWSNCSVYSIKSFLQEEKRAKCLFNTPYVGAKLPYILPGEIFSRDELCHRIMKTKSCSETKYVEDCVQLYCMSENGYCTSVPETAIPEGLSCGTDKYCINAKCISRNETVVRLKIGTEPPVYNSYEESYESD